MSYKPTIGLEIHAELKTRTKMFCNSANDPDETEPNVNVCPICMGHPGTLPTINKEAVRHVLKVGVAVGGTLADFTEFDRKNYFYPDIPKGFQISQYKYPLVTGGTLASVELTRVHLEEDTALNKHVEDSASRGDDHSLVDYNRAGIPLMELVTEPVMHSADEAVAFAKELQLLLRYLEVSEANMQKGELRIEANVSVSQKSKVKSQKLGTKTEIKNLNSFRAVGRAIDYEIKRQIKLLEEGGEVVQETRGWDENKQETFSQREKESSHDYRYFPEPDLPKLKLSEIPEFAEEVLREELPELPPERRARYKKQKLNADHIEFFVSNLELAHFFDSATEKLSDEERVLAANYIASDVAGIVAGGTSLSVSPHDFAELIQMVSAGDVSSRGAKDILSVMFEKGGAPRGIAEEYDLLQKSDEGELEKVAQQIIEENPDAVAEYKGGKETSLQFLVGQGMKATKGAANPQVLKESIKKLLNPKK